ncbi:MAG: iron-sulfur cluster assembly protein, partial [Gammaproteobacteria bacterium]|nr:iron-sulfur cluster assembly protein [Gammaproteobacteria bacterium]
MAIDKSQIETKLGEIQDPNMEADLVASKAVKSIEQDGDNWKVEIQLGYPAAGYFDELKQEIKTSLAGLEGI